MILKNISQQRIIAPQLQVAENFVDRLLGMMGKKAFPEGYALWIKKCNSVQTTFMHMPIDVIFLDRSQKVQKLIWNMKPWRFSPFVWSADSVVEIPPGRIEKDSIKLGDILNVES